MRSEIHDDPSTLEFIETVQRIQRSGFKITTLSYLLQDEDLTGKAAPLMGDILAVAKTVSDGLVKIELENTAEPPSTWDALKAQITSLYDGTTVDTFIELLKGVEETGSYANYVAKHPDAKAACDNLLGTHPDLKELCTTFENSAATSEGDKLAEVLQTLVPILKQDLKQAFVKQTLSSALNVSFTSLSELCQHPDIMHAAARPGVLAIDDLLQLEANGVSAAYDLHDDASKTADSAEIVPDIDYPTTDPKNAHMLPKNIDNVKTGITAVWKFYLDAPVNGTYIFALEADPGAEAHIFIEGNELSGNKSSLKAGRLYPIEVRVAHAKDKATLTWTAPGLATEVIPR